MRLERYKTEHDINPHPAAPPNEILLLLTDKPRNSVQYFIFLALEKVVFLFKCHVGIVLPARPAPRGSETILQSEGVRH